MHVVDELLVGGAPQVSHVVGVQDAVCQEVGGGGGYAGGETGGCGGFGHPVYWGGAGGCGQVFE